MRKLVLAIGTLLLSINAWSTTSLPHTMKMAVLEATHKSTSGNIIKTSFPIVYGGQDISRTRIATADVSVWSGQPVLIG